MLYANRIEYEIIFKTLIYHCYLYNRSSDYLRQVETRTSLHNVMTIKKLITRKDNRVSCLAQAGFAAFGKMLKPTVMDCPAGIASSNNL